MMNKKITAVLISGGLLASAIGVVAADTDFIDSVFSKDAVMKSLIENDDKPVKKFDERTITTASGVKYSQLGC